MSALNTPEEILTAKTGHGGFYCNINPIPGNEDIPREWIHRASQLWTLVVSGKVTPEGRAAFLRQYKAHVIAGYVSGVLRPDQFESRKQCIANVERNHA